MSNCIVETYINRAQLGVQIQRNDLDEMTAIRRELLEGMILKHEARRWNTARTEAAAAKKPVASVKPGSQVA